MNSPSSPPLHYFVDEAGDTTLFDSKGRVLVGQAGCSSYFILGRLEVDSPATLTAELNQLRRRLLADPYLNSIPSMRAEAKKTAKAFHAKDDCPEVRREVFQLLAGQSLKFSAVVRHKTAMLAAVRDRNQREPQYRYNGNEVYDWLVEELFRHPSRHANHTSICYAKRGNSARSAAFRMALKNADARMEQDFGHKPDGAREVLPSTPMQSAGLQACDYFLWALQRLYEQSAKPSESRYLSAMWPQVVEIHDVDVVFDGHIGATYNKKSPLVL